jgi:hypothetical protein
MKIRGTIAVIVLGAFCFFAGVTQGQSPTTGQITGAVKDPSGAVVSDAKVTLTNGAGVQREATSDVAGHFAFALLPPGSYRVETEKAGFSKATTEGAVVRITETSSLEVRLTLAAQRAVVEVQADSPLVQTESASRGTVIQQEQIRQLPLPTRNFQQLLTLTPGTSGPVQNSSELGRRRTSGRDQEPRHEKAESRNLVEPERCDRLQGHTSGRGSARYASTS